MKRYGSFEELTEEQKENLTEFAAVSVRCGREVLEAIEEQRPMTMELFRRCMDELGDLEAIGTLESVMRRWPEFGERYQKEEGWDREKKKEEFQKIMELAKKKTESGNEKSSR